MSTRMKKLAKSVAVLLLALQLALAPLPASASNFHWSGWVTNNACEWRGYHDYDEFGPGYAQAVTYGRGSCSEVGVRLWVNGSYTPGYGQTSAFAYVSGWGLDFNFSDHNADPEGPPPYVGFRLW